jgi:hypothetical protein
MRLKENRWLNFILLIEETVTPTSKCNTGPGLNPETKCICLLCINGNYYNYHAFNNKQKRLCCLGHLLYTI